MAQPSGAREGQERGAGSAASDIDFRLLVGLASDPIVVHDGGTIIYANEAAARFIGAPDAGSLQGRAFMDFVAPEFHASVTERATTLTARGGALGGNERVFVRFDGSRVEAETTGVALGDGRTLVALRDISRLAAAVRAQRFAESRLRAFYEVTQDAVGVAEGRTGTHLYVNPAHARIFGFDRPEDEAGTTVMDRIAPAERERVGDVARRLATGELPSLAFVTRGLRKDGTEFDLEVSVTAFPEGPEVIFAATMRDVTEGRRLERELRESERRFRELFEFVPISLWEVDASGVRAALDGMAANGVTDLRAHAEARPELVAEVMRAFRVTAVNAHGRSTAGARSDEELLRNLEKVHTVESFPRYRELGLQLAAGRPVAYAEGWAGTMAGERRWLATTATIIPGHEGDWRRLLFASVDLTERRRAEEERTALHERLRQSEKLEAVGRLAGGIAHDFNNILSGILGYTELTQLALDPASELHDHQQRIREATLRARDLVRQILAFSRRESPNRRVVDVPTVVREALTLMRAGVPASVTLEARIDPEAGATLADPTQLHQIVLNLSANARDAVSSYGHIEVAVEAIQLAGEVPGLPSGRYVRLRVRDDGAGMDDATRAHLFEPYMTTKGRKGGHGLGLAVVHAIVAAAGGAIQVESAPGKGSTFDVYLPRSELSAPGEAAPPRQVEGRGERILVVDDEPLVRGAHRRLLESLGYSVEVASDGEEALARFRESPASFDLVLTDKSMPRLDGIDLARAILELRPELPVILCTGYSDNVDEAAARRVGLRQLLPKPIDRATMAAALRRALEGG